MKTTKNLSIYVFTIILIVGFILCSFFNKCAVFADYGEFYGFDFDVKSKSVYFVNEDTGQLIYAKNEDEQIPAGALVKMMTIILILEAFDEKQLETFLETEIEAKGEIFDRLYGKSVSHADIRKGESVSVQDLIYASILASANEATMMLVDYVTKNMPEIFGNSVDDFVDKMQKKAGEIGLKNTAFTDPDGLDLSASQHTSAYDVYLLTKYCLKNALFNKIATTSIYDMAETQFHSKPRTIIHSNYMTNIGVGGKRYFDKRVRGIKTGAFSDSNGFDFYNLVSLAKDDSFTYVLVVLGAPKTREENSAFVDSNNFYDFVFKNLVCSTIAVPFEKVIPNNVKVTLGQGTDSLTLTTKEQVVVPWPKHVDVSSAFFDTAKLPKTIHAPVKKGQFIGKVDLKLAGQVLATVDAVACQNIDLDFIAFIGVCVMKIFKFLWVIILVVLILILTLWLVSRKINKKGGVNRMIKFKRGRHKKPIFKNRWTK